MSARDPESRYSSGENYPSGLKKPTLIYKKLRNTYKRIDKVAEPILTTSLILPNTKTAIRDPAEIRSKLSGDVDLILAAGECGSKPTSVVNLVEGMPLVEREGLGETTYFKC